MDDYEIINITVGNGDVSQSEGYLPGEAATQGPRNPMALVKEATLRELRSGNRSPFISGLAQLLGAWPSAERLREWANDQPERYFGGLAQVAKLAGYTDKVEGQSGRVDLTALSDAEIEERISEALAERAQLLP